MGKQQIAHQLMTPMPEMSISHPNQLYCFICHDPFYVSNIQAKTTHLLNAVCSDGCEERLIELREDNHWN